MHLTNSEGLQGKENTILAAAKDAHISDEWQQMCVKIPENETVRVCKAQVSVPNIHNGAPKKHHVCT